VVLSFRIVEKTSDCVIWGDGEDGWWHGWEKEKVCLLLLCAEEACDLPHVMPSNL
jgi:hypothetical protein